MGFEDYPVFRVLGSPKEKHPIYPQKLWVKPNRPKRRNTGTGTQLFPKPYWFLRRFLDFQYGFGLFAEKLFRSRTDANVRVSRAIFAELAGIGFQLIEVDNRRRIFIHIISVEPRQRIAYLVLAACQKVFALDGTEVEDSGLGGERDQAG